MQTGDLRLLDNKRPESILYLRPNPQPAATVVVFNLSYAGVKSMEWNEAVRTLRQFETTGYLYFYVLTNQGAMLPIHGLPERDAAPASGNAPWVDRSLLPFETPLSRESPQGRSGMSDLSPYLELARRMAAFPGRKSLVCIGCLFATGSDWERGPSLLSELSDALLEARVAVYPVGGRPPNGRIGVGNNEGGAMPGGPFVAPEQIGAFADITGGRTYAAGEIHDGIAEAIRDGKSTYRIAYLPPAQNWDGKRHKIAIGLARGKLHLLAPRWYLAGRLEDVAREQRPPIPDAAIASPFEQSDLAVSVSAPKKIEKALRIEIHVDAAGLLLLRRNGRYAGSVALQALCYTSAERPLACTEPMLVKLDLNQQEHAAALRGGLRFPLDIPMAATPTRMRVVACDEYTRACGTATFPLGEER
ncbi:MAG: hypothetical protein P4L56_03560 [Candidatus Sulfopaludibacter sp.]|nr:hypothetical protein [Candidatus Sulfopaludibacter sp.]